MQTRAAVAHKAGAPLSIETVDLGGPKAGEVLVEIKATGICHTDEYTLSGTDPEGLFPAVLGHEGAGVVVDVGPGVKSLKKSDHVIPLYVPECRECEYCVSDKTNLCQAIRVTQGQGLMPDGTSRFSIGSQSIHHYMGTSTFANYTVVPEISVAAGKIICISSVHEVIPWAGHVNYAASKGGVKLFMQSLAQELAPHRIRVNSIAPGAIQTPINRAVWETPAALQSLLTLIPYGRIGQPEDIGKAAVWLASDEADYVHGQTIVVDGGMTLYPEFARGG